MPVYYSSIWLSVYLATWLSDHLTIYLFSFFIYLFIDLRIWLSIHLTIYLAISVYLAIDRSIYLFIELSLKLSISVAICLMQGSMWQHWSCLSPSSKNPRLVPLDEIQSLYPFFFKSRSHVFTLCPNFIPADVCNWHYCWAMNYIQVPQYIFLFLLDLKLWILARAHLWKFKGAHTSRLWIGYTVFTVYQTFDGTSDHGNSSTKPVAYQKRINLMTSIFFIEDAAQGVKT